MGAFLPFTHLIVLIDYKKIAREIHTKNLM